MKKLLYILISVCLFSCTKDERPIINGKVVLEDGTPVEAAQIHYIPQLEVKSKPEKSKSTTTFQFMVTEPGHVKVETKVAWDEKLIETLLDRQMTPGTHTVPLVDSLYTNRVYFIEFTLPGIDTVNVHKFFKSAPAEELWNVAPLRETNSGGRFELQLGELGIGEEFELFTGGMPTTMYIVNQVEFIAIKNGEVIARKEVELSEGKTNVIELVVSQ